MEMETYSTSVDFFFAELRMTLEARGCKPLVTNLAFVPRTLGILAANIIPTV